METERQALRYVPLRSRARAEHGDLVLFLRGDIDEVKLEDLLWGLALLDRRKNWKLKREAVSFGESLPRAYALLKLAFLPGNLKLQGFEYEVWPEMAILGKLRAAQLEAACKLAARRLRIAGLIPAWDGAEQTGIDAKRLAASLLFPVWDEQELARMVIRINESKKEEALEA